MRYVIAYMSFAAPSAAGQQSGQPGWPHVLESTSTEPVDTESSRPRTHKPPPGPFVMSSTNLLSSSDAEMLLKPTSIACTRMTLVSPAVGVVRAAPTPEAVVVGGSTLPGTNVICFGNSPLLVMFTQASSCCDSNSIYRVYVPAVSGSYEAMYRPIYMVRRKRKENEELSMLPC